MSKPTTKKKSSSSTTESSQRIVFSKPNGPTYISVGTNGTGTFGVVYKAKNKDTGEVVAIKRVLQDMRYKVIVLFTNLKTVPKMIYRTVSLKL